MTGKRCKRNSVQYKAILIIVAILCLMAIIKVWATPHYEPMMDISKSAIHDYQIVLIEEETDGAVDSADSDDSLADSAVPDDGGLTEESTEWTISRQAIIDKAYELYGVSKEWTIWLIGTTHNEQYYDDRYLEYAWACAVIHEYRYWSVWDLDCIWGSYYSIGNAYSGYYAADDWTLSNVYEALINRDTRIVECDGMITYPPAGYYLIYDSPEYNCQVWGN